MSTEFNARLKEYDNLIWSMALQWHRLNPTVAIEDLHQEGLIALDAVINEHDDSRAGFTSYLWISIKRRMRRWTAMARDTIRVPETKLIKTRYTERVACCSLSVSNMEGGRTLEEIIPAPEPEATLLDEDMSKLLHAAITKLRPTEREVIIARYYEEKPSKIVAAEMGLTRQRVEQIEKAAITSLRFNRRLMAA